MNKNTNTANKNTDAAVAHMSMAFKMLEEIYVRRENVERMAAAKQELRHAIAALQMPKAEAKKPMADEAEVPKN